MNDYPDAPDAPDLEFAPISAYPAKSQKIKPNQPWQALIHTTEKGQPIANVANVLTHLRHDQDIKTVFARDEMNRKIMVVQPIPGVEYDNFKPYQVRDCDTTWVQEYVQSEVGIRRIGRDIIFSAIQARAFENSYHPLRDELNALVWDKTPRLERWLSYYLGAEYTPYTREIGRLFMISMIARIMQPGCKCDYVMVLEGDQGARKSTACQILGGQYFGDQLPDLAHGNKDISSYLNGKWVIEISELSSMDRSESNALKAFITRAKEEYRPSHGQFEVSEPRQCVFIGTTNKTAYLQDETGGRRFWPVKVGKIDTDALAHDRSQLLAEATHLYHSGAQWWPDGDFERQYIAPQQEVRFEADVWEDAILEYLTGDAHWRTEVSILELAKSSLNLDKAAIRTGEQRRIIKILNRLGWFPKRKTNTGVKYAKVQKDDIYFDTE